MELKTVIAGLELEHPIMNAAGTCKQLEGKEGVTNVARSAASAVVLGSITVEPKEGNKGEVYYTSEIFSLNSLGLNNPGIEAITRDLPKMADICHRANKPLLVSLAGFNPIDYGFLAKLAKAGCADGIELNFGCPNLWEEGEQKPIIGFQRGMVAESIKQVVGEISIAIPIGLKFPPFTDPITLAKTADLIVHNWEEATSFITTTNTFPNAYSCDEQGNQCIAPEQGLAGLGGPAMKPIGLGQVKQWRALLPDSIDIIGVGGISTGQDVLDYLRAGAKAVQVATAFLDEGPRFFERVVSEYADLVMKQQSV